MTVDIRKLQRTIVDALEDVKGHDITVLNTAHLSDMFERVIIASGTSNRQTRSLASSVEEKVRAAGGDIISVEGTDAGEWVLVDCGDAVVHIMQPTFRDYYNLEELWGDKPVRLKSAATAAEKSDRGTRATAKKAVKKGSSRERKPKTARPKPGAS